MSQEKAKDIPLVLVPNPEGDNCFEVSISEGTVSLTYLASKWESDVLVNAGDVSLIFLNCVASKYLGTEPEGELYPGWHQLESDFCIIEHSQWAASFTSEGIIYQHYVFQLNHQVIECIAASYRVGDANSEQNS